MTTDERTDGQLSRSGFLRTGRLRLSASDKEFMLTCNERLEQEAETAGLILVDAGRNKAYRLYRFTNCGHQQEIATSAVRQKRLRCQRCLEQTHAEEATVAGLELLGPGRVSRYRRYKFVSCSHEQEMQVSQVRSGCVRCRSCIKQKQAQEAIRAGIEMMGAGATARTRMYRFVRCGHAQELHVTAVRDGSFRCKSCSTRQLTILNSL